MRLTVRQTTTRRFTSHPRLRSHCHGRSRMVLSRGVLLSAAFLCGALSGCGEVPACDRDLYASLVVRICGQLPGPFAVHGQRACVDAYVRCQDDTQNEMVCDRWEVFAQRAGMCDMVATIGGNTYMASTMLVQVPGCEGKFVSESGENPVLLGPGCSGAVGD